MLLFPCVLFFLQYRNKDFYIGYINISIQTITVPYKNKRDIAYNLIKSLEIKHIFLIYKISNTYAFSITDVLLTFIEKILSSYIRENLHYLLLFDLFELK